MHYQKIQIKRKQIWALKDKDQYSILTHTYGILKDGNDNPICKTEKETDVQNRLLDSVGEGEGGIF